MEIFVRTVLLGLVTGSVYALASTGLVLTYKTSGILNFGYGAIAVFTSFVYWQLTAGWSWPVGLAAAVVILIVAPLLGVVLETQLFRRIEGQPQIIGVIATIGLFVLLQGLVLLIWGGETRANVPSLFPAGSVKLLGIAKVGKDQLGVLLVAATAAGLLGAMLRYTRLGIAFRAVVNNRPVAGLMAINTGFVSGLAWALSTAFAALVGILLTPRLFLDVNFLPPFIIAFVLGAAVFGYLRSLPLAYIGGLAIGIAEALLIQYGGSEGVFGKARDALPFLAIMVAVLVAPKALRQASAGASFIVRTRELGAAPRHEPRPAIVAFAVLALAPVLTGNSISWKISLITGMTSAIVFISLVILTGYSGQISLGHSAFMGIATFAAAHFVSGLGLPMWIALPLGALAAVPAGVLVGLLAVRLHGLFLALVTLAFAFMAQQLFFSDPRISGGEGGIAVPRPAGATGTTALYFLVLVVLALSVLLAVNLRTGRTGRVLAGLRDSEVACRSLGVPVTKYKVFIFGLSAFIAGFGAILGSMTLEQATSRTFIPFFSLLYMTLTVLGGVFHVGGAIIGGLFFGVFPKIAESFPFLNRISYILFGLGATLALAWNPEGLYGELRRAGYALEEFRGRRRARRVAAGLVSGAR
jgi:ABC-type branched-subunit amino acid transport system permease subunit